MGPGRTIWFERGGWVFRRLDAKDNWGPFRTQRMALAEARRLQADEGGGVLTALDQDGSVQLVEMVAEHPRRTRWREGAR